MLEQFQCKLTVDSSFKTGTTFSFSVIMMPSLVKNLDFGGSKNNLFPSIHKQPPEKEGLNRSSTSY